MSRNDPIHQLRTIFSSIERPQNSSISKQTQLPTSSFHNYPTPIKPNLVPKKRKSRRLNGRKHKVTIELIKQPFFNSKKKRSVSQQFKSVVTDIKDSTEALIGDVKKNEETNVLRCQFIEEEASIDEQVESWQPKTKQQKVLLEIQKKIDQYLYFQRVRFARPVEKIFLKKIKHFLQESEGYTFNQKILERLMKVNSKLYKVFKVETQKIIKPLNLLSQEKIHDRLLQTKAKMKKLIEKQENSDTKTFL